MLDQPLGRPRPYGLILLQLLIKPIPALPKSDLRNLVLLVHSSLLLRKRWHLWQSGLCRKSCPTSSSPAFWVRDQNTSRTWASVSSSTPQEYPNHTEDMSESWMWTSRTTPRRTSTLISRLPYPKTDHACLLTLFANSFHYFAYVFTMFLQYHNF